MAMNGATAGAMAREIFGIVGKLDPLPGEFDANFRVSAEDGKFYLLKIHAPHWPDAEIAAQAAVLIHLAARAPDLPIAPPIASPSGDILPRARDNAGKAHRLRLTPWLPGHAWADRKPQKPATYRALGEMLGRLDAALADFDHAGLDRDYAWDLRLAARHIEACALIADSEAREAAMRCLVDFRDHIAPALASLPRQAIHNDANDRNLLLEDEGRISGLLDFGDMVKSWRVNEIAIAAAYALIGTADPIGAILPLLAAYHDVNPLSEIEIDHLFDLIRTRFAVSMAMAARQIRDRPENAYLLVSQADVWREFQRLDKLNPHLARMRLRVACGYPAHREGPAIRRWLALNNDRFGPVVAPDLSPERLGILEATLPGADIAERLRALAPRIPIGLYGEDRAIYDGPNFATAPGEESRRIHIGIDIFLPAGEAVFAAYPGHVEGIADDRVKAGFGGLVVLRHETDEGHSFWTLYGHLSPASLAALAPGQSVAKGEVIGRLGTPAENGEWPPHLHFQLMTHLLGWRAIEILGVVWQSQWEVWSEICPNPNLVLGLGLETAARVAQSPEDLERQRRRHIGRALGLAYAEPLKIERGAGCYLYDHRGRAYLDMVNNVAHIGHGHPRLVDAAARQMAQLNTNARYLHDNLVEYARRLAAILPAELSTLFFVNSGSEANDLALRLANAYTGRSDILVVDHAYHGHLSSLIDISPYKFFGPGGKGRKDHVWVAETPDPYRGRLRAGAPDLGPRYAESVATLLRDMAGIGRQPMAFIAESIQGCAGQIPFPSGYLAAAYDHVRQAGGLCIADEVQVGFGRVGTHYWAFETQGVIPDIVTMGKPIGAGHPLAAVAVRPAIAAAFANGMEYFNTFGGNPVSAAIGLAVLDVIAEERLLPRARRMGALIQEGLRQLALRYPVIGDVRGLGLFIGAEFVADALSRKPAPALLARVIEAMKAKGVLLSSEGPGHNVLKIKPSLVIGETEIADFLAKLEICLQESA